MVIAVDEEGISGFEDVAKKVLFSCVDGTLGDMDDNVCKKLGMDDVDVACVNSSGIIGVRVVVLHMD